MTAPCAPHAATKAPDENVQAYSPLSKKVILQPSCSCFFIPRSIFNDSFGQEPLITEPTLKMEYVL